MGGGTASAESAGLTDPWYAYLAAFLGGFPDDYLVFDCETNGLDPRSVRTLPVELGYCMVKGRVPVDEGGFLINWALLPAIDARWFEGSVRETARRMEEKGNTPTTWESIRDKGHDPREVVPHFRDFLVEAHEKDYKYVGHNVYAFDRPIVENATFTATGDRFRFDYRRFLDTGMLFKSKATGFKIPQPGSQPVFRWYEDVSGYIRQGKWNLGHCLRTFGLDHRHHINMEELHGAQQDCRVTHYLLEEFRDLAEAAA